MSLTTKQRRFVEEYIGPANFNATEAARRAGYSEKTAYSIGHENLSKPEIEAAIESRLDELSMSAAEATKRLTEWARADPSDVIEIQTDGSWVLDLEKAQKSGAIRLVKELSYDAEGRPKVKLHDAKDAAIQIAKIRGLYVDRVRHEGSVEVRTVRLPATETDPNEWAEKFRGAGAASGDHSGNGSGK